MELVIDLDKNAELSWLMSQAQGDLNDAHEIQMRLQQMIATMRAEGLPLPQDLVDLEAKLDKEFETDARGVRG